MHFTLCNILNILSKMNLACFYVLYYFIIVCHPVSFVNINTKAENKVIIENIYGSNNPLPRSEFLHCCNHLPIFQISIFFFGINLNKYLKFICQKRKRPNIYALYQAGEIAKVLQKTNPCLSECRSIPINHLPNFPATLAKVDLFPLFQLPSYPCCFLDTPGILIPSKSRFFLRCPFTQIAA